MFLQGEHLQWVCSLQHLLLGLRLSKGEQNLAYEGTKKDWEEQILNMEKGDNFSKLYLLQCDLQWQFTTGYNNLPLCVLPGERWLLPMIGVS